MGRTRARPAAWATLTITSTILTVPPACAFMVVPQTKANGALPEIMVLGSTQPHCSSIKAYGPSSNKATKYWQSSSRLHMGPPPDGGVGHGDFEQVRRGLVNQEFTTLLQEKNTKECVQFLHNSTSMIDLDMQKASTLLNGVSTEVLAAQDPDAKEMSFVYDTLKKAGLLKGYGCVDMNLLPEKRRDISPQLLESLAGMSMSALTPGKGDNLWLYSGIAICALEFLGGRYLGLDPLSTVIPVTLAAFAVDRLALRGALFESITRIVVPSYKDKIIKHEAGHFLLAYLLGCPVQGCVLDPWEVGKYVSAGQGGTIFADPQFSQGIASGQLTRSSIDRFTIILMAGIAAEALTFGKAEGGLADENVLINILSTITPPFSFEQIRKQARWSAVQAMLLIKEHRSAYDALVEELRRGATLGECVAAIEGELAKAPLPVSTRTPAKPADLGEELRSLLQEKFAASDEGKTLGDKVQEKEAATKLFQEKRIALEKQMAQTEGELKSVIGGNEGGVWLNGLQALQSAPAESGSAPSAISRLRASPKDLATTQSRQDDIAKRLQEVEARLKELNSQKSQA